MTSGLEDHAGEPRKIDIGIYNQDTSLSHACVTSRARAVMARGNYR